MLDSYIKWNNTRSDSLGLIIKKEPNFNKPKRRYQSYSQEAKNGDFVLMDNAWENVIQEYQLFIDMNQVNVSLAEECHLIANWLHSTDDYAELTDSYDTTHYRMAYMVDEIKIENHLNEFATATVRFNCRPEYYLNSGKTATDYTTFPISITNPTQYDSYPLIKITKTSSGDVGLKFNNSQTIVTGDGKSTVYIDCDKRSVSTSSAGTSNFIKFTASNIFPKLKAGSNSITITEGSDLITKITITPRWWEL